MAIGLTKTFKGALWALLLSILLAGCLLNDPDPASPAKAITAYSLAGVTATVAEANKTIALTVPFGTDVTGLVATFATTGESVKVGATAQISGVTANDFSAPVAYTVTAADGSAANYTVTVAVAPSTAKAITAFSLAGVAGTINETNKTIAVVVPFGTDVSALVATYTITGAAVSVGSVAQTSGASANDFTAPLAYQVSAADAGTADYTVTVTVAPNAAKAISAYSLSGVAGTIDEAAKAIAVVMPFGTDVTALVATYTTTGASVAVGAAAQASGVTANDFSAPVAYTVTAADASTTNYTVSVSVAASPARAITAFSLAGMSGSIDEAAKTIAVTAPLGTDVTALVATYTTSGASVKVGATVQISGATANNFSAPVAYTVTAADGGSANYTVTVTLASLPDSGVTASQCYAAGSNTLVDCTGAAAIALNARQDGMVGLDVTNPGNADGKLGFSYSAVAGGCVKDNVTGLMWEVKTTDGGLRDANKTYTNYDDASKAQKWNGSSYVNPSQAEIDAATNTRGYVAAVNAAGLCGYGDWRLPTADELQGLVDYGVAYPGPTIDAVWFPNTKGSWYWTSSPYAGDSGYAWGVDFGYGGVVSGNRDYAGYVRLVR